MGLRDVVTQTPGSKPGESDKEKKDSGPIEIFGPDGEPFEDEESPPSKSAHTQKPRAESSLLDARAKAQLRGMVDDSRQAMEKAKALPGVGYIFQFWILALGLLISYSIVHGRVGLYVPTDGAIFDAIAQAQAINPSYSTNDALEKARLDVADIRIGRCTHSSGADVTWRCSVSYSYADTQGARHEDSETVTIVRQETDAGMGNTTCKECSQSWVLTQNGGPGLFDGTQFTHLPYVAKKQGGAQ